MWARFILDTPTTCNTQESFPGVLLGQRAFTGSHRDLEIKVTR